MTKRKAGPVAIACRLALCWPMLSGPRLACQSTSADPNAATTQTYSVAGTVVNSVTRQPIAHVLVNAEQDAALTNNDGHFELRLQAGIAQILVQRPGYNSTQSYVRHMVQVGADLPQLTFSLTPDALISGQVMLPDSDTADGIQVMAYRQSLVNGRPEWIMQQGAMTNSEGLFRLAGLQPGSYLLRTQMEQDRDRLHSATAIVNGYPAAYYPGVAEPSAAGVVTLTAGEHAQADFTLARQPFYSVTVAVTNQDVSGGIGLQVFDAGGRDINASIHRNPQQGTLEVSLPNGRYFLEARSGFNRRNQAEAGAFGRIEFKVASAPVSGLSMTLLPLHAVPVNVRKDFTARNSEAAAQGSAGGAMIYSGAPPRLGVPGDLEPPPLNLVLTPADGFYQQGSVGLRPRRGSTDGTSFELEAVPPGRYWVTTSPSQGYVSSITSGAVDLSREPLVVGQGSTSAPIDVTLRDDFGTIAGQIGQDARSTSTMGGLPLGEQRQIYLYAIPLFATTAQAPIGTGALPSGEFAIGNLSPGSYQVVAFDSPREIDFHTAEGLAKYAGKGPTATVEAGGTVNVRLDSVLTGETQ